MSSIGMFDSGVGGLTVLNVLARSFPHTNFYFIGDNQRAPYGSRSLEEIKSFSRELIEALAKNKPDLVVAACNTASSIGFDRIQRDFNFPILGIIEPTAQLASRRSKNHDIAVIATEKTIESQAYQHSLEKANPENVVHSQATPDLVPIVEDNLMGTSQAATRVRQAMGDLLDESFDTLILGCTHYPFLQAEIEQALNRPVQLIDASMAIVDKIKEKQDELSVAEQEAKNREIKLYTTGDPDQFEQIADDLLQGLDYTIEKVEL